MEDAAVPQLTASTGSLSWTSTAAAIVLLIAALYAGARWRLLPHHVLRFWFCTSLVLWFCLLGVIRLGLLPLKATGCLSNDHYAQLLRQLTAAAMHAHRYMNPHIRMIRVSSSMDWAELTGERHLLMMNHVSKQELFGGLWIAPLSYMRQMRIFFKGSVATDVPILGTLLVDAGCFPVHYTSEQWDNFQVHREQQQTVTASADAFLGAGGTIMLAPEGCINRHPRQLRDFRLGSFELALKHRMPMAFLVYAGNHAVWPPEETFGGFPSDVFYAIHRFPVDYDEPGLDSKLLASRLRARMQEVLDELMVHYDKSAAMNPAQKRQDVECGGGGSDSSPMSS